MHTHQDPTRVTEAERHGCGKRAWGVAVTRRGGTLLVIAIAIAALLLLLTS